MKFKGYHLSQMNIARMHAPLEDPIMSGFVAKLAEINKLADDSPGFVWRLQSEEGDATYIRPYDDDRVLFNMSVWESVDALKKYVYDSGHSDVMRNRREWFEKMSDAYSALWWIKEGHTPSVQEAKLRLEYLQKNGPSSHVFTFKKLYEPHDLIEKSFLVPSNLNWCAG
jgi:hypothetical protein